MLWADLALRWFHILSAAVLAGGVIFWRAALLPASGSLAEGVRAEVSAAVRSRWAKLVMVTSGLLLVTGLINFMLTVQRFEFDKSAFPASKYHMLFGIKFLLSLGVFMLSALLAGRTGAAEKLRQSERFWLNVNVLLVVAVVCLGGLLRASVRQPKSPQSLRTLQSIPAESQGERVAFHPPATLTMWPRGE